MAAKIQKTNLRSSANGHAEMEQKATSSKQDKVVILDAGAQYGKVRL